MPNQDVIVKYLFYSVDFVIIWAMIYWVLYFLRGTRSANVLFGVIAVLLTATIAVDYVERLTVLRFLLIECLIPSLGLAILVIFQPEFRRTVGRTPARLPGCHVTLDAAADRGNTDLQACTVPGVRKTRSLTAGYGAHHRHSRQPEAGRGRRLRLAPSSVPQCWRFFA